MAYNNRNFVHSEAQSGHSLSNDENRQYFSGSTYATRSNSQCHPSASEPQTRWIQDNMTSRYPTLSMQSPEKSHHTVLPMGEISVKESNPCFQIRMEHVDLLEGFQIGAAEFLGTAVLLMMGCAISGPVMPWTFAFAIIAAVQIFGPISGCHINPVVTCAAFIMGQIKHPILVPIYIICQYLGALFGYTLHYYIVLTSFDSYKAICATVPPPGMTSWQALVLEIIMTWILVMAICALWDTKNKHSSDTASLKLGLIIGGLIFTMTSIVPISLNPARSLAPSVLNNLWDAHWVYVIGPFLGAIIAALMYRCLFNYRPYLKT